MSNPRQQWWTVEQKALLEQLRGENCDWDEIAVRCRHTIGSCKTTLSNILTRRTERAAADGETVPKKKAPKRPWTEPEVQTMIRLREVEGKRWNEIDAALGRANGSACGKYDSLRRFKVSDRQVSLLGGGSRIDAGAAERARDARKHLEHDSLTAAFCGDPLPGRSALDQKRAQQT